jgi:hypothetical protein
MRYLWLRQRQKEEETAWGTRAKADQTLGVAAAALRPMTAEVNPGAEAAEARDPAREATVVSLVDISPSISVKSK